MRRYHAEKHIIENRAKKYRQINAGWLEFDTAPRANREQSDHVIEDGQFRKSRRCGGCGRSKCQVCHPEKYPKRIPTRQELQAQKDFNQHVNEF